MAALPTTESKLWRSFGIDLPLRLAAEILTFGSRRLQAQAEHVAALGRCGSPAETIELQTDFLMKTFTDYQREADALSRDVVDIAVPGEHRPRRLRPGFGLGTVGRTGGGHRRDEPTLRCIEGAFVSATSARDRHRSEDRPLLVPPRIASRRREWP